MVPVLRLYFAYDSTMRGGKSKSTIQIHKEIIQWKLKALSKSTNTNNINLSSWSRKMADEWL